MPRYIDADWLLERAVPMGWSTPLWVTDIAIKDAPTADVVEAKHGEWIDEPNCWYRCSYCGTHYSSIIGTMEYNYCPNCGADMREEKTKE